MSQEVFNRYEFKYVIHRDKYKKVLQALKGYIQTDTYGDSEGHYKIHSLYYDSMEDVFFHETLDGTVFRQKLRLRGYNHVSLEDEVFLEVKQKHDGVVNKRRTRMKLKDAYDFLRLDNQAPLEGYQASNMQILNEIYFLKNFYHLKPKILVTYDRQAFQGIEERDLRITFDTNLRKQEFNFDLEKNSEGELFIDPNLGVLEVKADSRIPFWLSRILSEYECTKQGVSKYCIGYGQTISDGDVPVPQAI